MKLLATFTLLTIYLNAVGQISPIKKALTFFPGTYIDTEARYTDPTGIDVIIQNSLPKWGTQLLDSIRREQGFSSLVFFNRIINEANVPIELTIKFPTDSFPSPDSSEAYLKIFLPRDTMTLDKEAAYSYGIASLESLFDSGSAKPNTLQRTIEPKQEYLFYVVVLFYQPMTQQYPGFFQSGTRARLVVEEQNIFYKINHLNYTSILCGKIVLKKH